MEIRQLGTTAMGVAQSSRIITIPGSRRTANIRSNFETQNIRLSTEEIAAIDGLLERIDIPVFGGSKIANE